MARTPSSHNAARAGQAIAEFVVGLVGLLILVAALLQIGTLVREDNRTLQKARAQAGMAALSDAYIAPVLPGPRYLRDWTTGPDNAAYTRDDEPVQGDAVLFSQGLLDHARPAALAGCLPNNPLSPMADPANLMAGLRFVRGSADSGPISLLPITRKLIFGRDTITLESEAYLIWTKGLR
jgi:hypothetical protein